MYINKVFITLLVWFRSDGIEFLLIRKNVRKISLLVSTIQYNKDMLKTDRIFFY